MDPILARGRTAEGRSFVHTALRLQGRYLRNSYEGTRLLESRTLPAYAWQGRLSMFPAERCVGFGTVFSTLLASSVEGLLEPLIETTMLLAVWRWSGIIPDSILDRRKSLRPWG